MAIRRENGDNSLLSCSPWVSRWSTGISRGRPTDGAYRLFLRRVRIRRALRKDHGVQALYRALKPGRRRSGASTYVRRRKNPNPSRAPPSI